MVTLTKFQGHRVSLKCGLSVFCFDIDISDTKCSTVMKFGQKINLIQLFTMLCHKVTLTLNLDLTHVSHTGFALLVF